MKVGGSISALIITWFIVNCCSANKTVLSFAFDDGWQSQTKILDIFEKYNYKGTFFINSDRIDKNNFLSFQQIQFLYDTGHEIGGHTRNHYNLTNVNTIDVVDQVCKDRAVLFYNEWEPMNFAYPFGDVNELAARVVRECGYNSGRTTGYIETQTSCKSCFPAEAIPPRKPYRIISISIQNPHTFEFLKFQISNAVSKGGGWVIMNFHEFCEDCSSIGLG